MTNRFLHFIRSMNTLLHKAAFIIAMGLCGHAAIAQNSTPAQPIAAASVTVAKVETQEFVAQTAISGSVIARNAVSVVPQIAGYPVTSINVDIGDRVTKGDVLATLDNAAALAQLEQVDAQIETAQSTIRQSQSQIVSATAQADEAAATLTRTQTLVAGGSLSQSTLDQAQATSRTAAATLASAKDGLTAAQAQLRQVQAQRAIAQLALDHTSLLAPVSGVIATRNISLGDLTPTGSAAAFVIYEDGALEIAAEVVETSLSAVAVGDKVSLIVAGQSGLTGKVRLIAPTVNATTRLGTVNITPETITGLRAGLFVGGWIITDERSALGVPTTAIQTDNTGSFVYVVNDGILTQTPVTTGLIWHGQREILSGLTVGQIVVARAGGFFADGDQVNPITTGANP